MYKNECKIDALMYNLDIKVGNFVLYLIDIKLISNLISINR